MSNKKSYTIAVIVLVVAIVAALVVGQVRKPDDQGPSVSADGYERYISDGARVLTASQKETICSYNAAWDSRCGGVMAFVSVAELSGSWEDYAISWSDSNRLSSMSGVLLYVSSEDDYTIYCNGSLLSNISTTDQIRLTDTLNDTSISFAAATMNFYARMDRIMPSSGGSAAESSSAVPSILLVIILIIVVLCICNAIDKARYDAYRTRYYGVPTPPVVYRPILFWHAPGTSWYRRNWRPPTTTTRPPRGPSGGSFGGSSFSSGRPSGSSFSSGRSSGGSFGGGRSSGGSFGGGRSSGGSFGGGRSSGGSFGGGRGRK